MFREDRIKKISQGAMKNGKRKCGFFLLKYKKFQTADLFKLYFFVLG